MGRYAWGAAYNYNNVAWCIYHVLTTTTFPSILRITGLCNGLVVSSNPIMFRSEAANNTTWSEGMCMVLPKGLCIKASQLKHRGFHSSSPPPSSASPSLLPSLDPSPPLSSLPPSPSPSFPPYPSLLSLPYLPPPPPSPLALPLLPSLPPPPLPPSLPHTLTQ